MSNNRKKIDEKGISLLKENEFVVDIAYDKNREEVEEIIGEYDVLLVRAETQVDRKLIDLGKKT